MLCRRRGQSARNTDIGDYLGERDDAIDAQVFLELTEANVSSDADAGAWATDIGFLREGDDGAGAVDAVEFGDVVADASLLA